MLQLLFNGFVNGLIYGLVALGFHLIYRGTKILHIAHGAIYTATAYALIAGALIFHVDLSGLPTLQIAIPVVVALLTACLLGVLSETLIYYPLFSRRVSPLVAFITSLGLYIVIVNFVAMFFGNEPRLPVPNINSTAFAISVVTVTRIQVVKIIISGTILLLVLLSLSLTRFGRNFRAVSDNPVLAALLGMDVRRIRIVVFAGGSMLAGACSLLQVLDVGVNPQIGLAVTLAAAVAVIIGGRDSAYGAVIGAICIGIARSVVTYLFSAEWEDAVPIAFFVVLVMVRRGGFIERRTRLEEA
jgi:branched-chain amino acid transport system permease protein